jgi:hypothetical protein
VNELAGAISLIAPRLRVAAGGTVTPIEAGQTLMAQDSLDG